MAEAGILGPDERIELIRGVVHTMSPKGRAHTVAGARVSRILDRKLEGRASVYPEASLPFPELSSEPQPDVVVCSSPDIDAVFRNTGSSTSSTACWSSFAIPGMGVMRRNLVSGRTLA